MRKIEINDKIVPYPPLASLKEILIKFEINVDELGLSDNLLKLNLKDCYTKKIVTDSEIKIYGSYMNYFYYETIINLEKHDLTDIMIIDNNKKTTTYFDSNGVSLDLFYGRLNISEVKP